MADNRRGLNVLGSLILLTAGFPTAWLGAHQGVHDQITDTSRRLEQSPEDAALYLKRGELYRLHQQWEKAKGDYHKARALDPELVAVDLCLGRLFLAEGKPAAAKSALDRFLQEKPGHVKALAARARAWSQTGTPLKAARDYTRAIEQIPGQAKPDPDYYLQRARALATAGDDHLDESLRGLEEGLERLGPIVSLQLAALDLEVRLRRHGAALERVDAIVAHSPRKETWLWRRGQILEDAGRYATARQSYEDALAAIDRLPENRRNVSSVAELEKRLQQAFVRLKLVRQPERVVRKEVRE